MNANRSALLITIACSLLLGACSDGDDGGAAPAWPTAADLCVSSDCGHRDVLLDIPSAENLHFTDDGRLFVSSGVGFYEILRNDDGSYRTEPAYDGPTCGFTGVASRNGYLYVACGDGTLWGGPLEAQTKVKPIFQI